jgi:tryptophan-rich sensory protein
MTEQMTETSTTHEEKPDTYHNQGALVRIADIAGWISWVFLVLFVACGAIIAYFGYYFYKNHGTFEQFILSLPAFLVPFFLAGFIWIALKVISEAVYLLMDIEDNTRRPQPSAKE